MLRLTEINLYYRTPDAIDELSRKHMSLEPGSTVQAKNVCDF
jgi:hypothetical protein